MYSVSSFRSNCTFRLILELERCSFDKPVLLFCQTKDASFKTYPASFLKFCPILKIGTFGTPLVAQLSVDLRKIWIPIEFLKSIRII